MERKVTGCNIDLFDKKLKDGLKNMLRSIGGKSAKTGIRLFINYSPVYCVMRDNSGKYVNVPVKVKLALDEQNNQILEIFSRLDINHKSSFSESNQDITLNNYLFKGEVFGIKLFKEPLTKDDFTIIYSGGFINILQTTYQTLVEGLYLKGPRRQGVCIAKQDISGKDCIRLFNNFEREFIRIYFKFTNENTEESIMKQKSCCVYGILSNCFLLMRKAEYFIHPILDVDCRREQFEGLKIFEETKLFTKKIKGLKENMYIFSTYAGLYRSTNLTKIVKIDHLQIFKILLGYICGQTYVDSDPYSNDVLTINPNDYEVYKLGDVKIDKLTAEEKDDVRSLVKLNSTDYLNLSEDIKTIINGFKFLSSNETKQQPSSQNDLEEEEIYL